jgi:hypothetical protein
VTVLYLPNERLVVAELLQQLGHQQRLFVLD